MRIADWVIGKLEPVRTCPRVLVRDPLRLLPERDAALHEFAVAHGFTVIVAATNLVFRELYQNALADPETQKLLVIDRAPARRRHVSASNQAPAPFYPDLLANTPVEARIELDVRQLLRDLTGDPAWPQDANNPRYARLIVPHLDGVLRAYANLHTAYPGRFTDSDFQRIVAFAALGVPESAFKKLDAADYWKIGLEGHDALEELADLAPEVTETVKGELLKAPAPFRWLAKQDPDTVTRALYLSVILAQHFPQWHAVLASIEPSLAHLGTISPDVLDEAAPKLVALDPEQAQRDLEGVERSLTADTLKTLLFDQMHLQMPEDFTRVLQHERYSTLLRCLALLAALDNLLGQANMEAQTRVAEAVLPQRSAELVAFVERRQSMPWANLKEAYTLAHELHELRLKLAAAIREAAVKPRDEQTFAYFWKLWNDDRLNRVEYTVSSLKRVLESAELLPRNEEDLPPAFANMLRGMRQRVRIIYDDVYKQLDELNRHFQEVVASEYPRWLQGTTDVKLTSQFLRRAVKPYWDPQTEKAVVFVFDGMRYDIWDELLRPMLEERLEVLADDMGCSLLPSETHISRWGLAAGAEPKDYLYPHKGESAFLKPALAREFGYDVPVQTVAPEGAGTGETVRYRAGNLDYYIFEMCDKELHKIQMKQLPDGRMEPTRPLTFIYQMLKDMIDNEVMAIVRQLKPGTKVFITADHGFGPIREQALWFDAHDLNADDDCSYRNCLLAVPFQQADLPPQSRQQMIAFTPDQLGMPKRKPYMNRASGQTEYGEIKAIVFPRVGYAFSRKGSKFNPSAYSHGGISIQELLIPMVTLRVRQKDDSPLALGQISGPKQPVEGEEMEFRMRISPATLFSLPDGELKVTVEANYSRDPDANSLPSQVLYVSAQGAEVVYRFRADRSDATEDELREGRMTRTLTVSVSYRDGRRTTRKAQTFPFTVQLNSERVARRVPTSLGSIMGMMPKNVG